MWSGTRNNLLKTSCGCWPGQGSPTKNTVILVTDILGWGVDPNDDDQKANELLAFQWYVCFEVVKALIGRQI